MKRIDHSGGVSVIGAAILVNSDFYAGEISDIDDNVTIGVSENDTLSISCVGHKNRFFIVADLNSAAINEQRKK